MASNSKSKEVETLVDTDGSASMSLPHGDGMGEDSNHLSASTIKFDDDQSLDLEDANPNVKKNLFGDSAFDSMDFQVDGEEEYEANGKTKLSRTTSVAEVQLKSLTMIRRISMVTVLVSLGTAAAMSYLFVTDIMDTEGTTEESGDSDLMNQVLLPGIAVAMILPVMFCFLLYDFASQRAIHKLVRAANKSTAVVNSLFPENVRERVLKQESRRAKSWRRRNKKKKAIAYSPANTVSTSNSFFSQATSTPKATKKTSSAMDLIPKEILSSKPIADFFPHCTVLFADIVGFTAWSSVRDPTDVFTLLESLYSSFDTIAQRRKVFKVETIGDCYVAVTGLPEPIQDHAVVMAKFARQCMWKMMDIVRALEIHLGPDTGDLSMRFGLHSGPVTAGVMRGEKSRFQLFGDTVNTAARVESTGERGKIHLSEETADLIIEAGKQHWLTARKNKVKAKGKGDLQTYWLEVNPQAIQNNHSAELLFDELEGKDQSTKDGSPQKGVSGLVALFETAEKLNTLDERTLRQSDYTVEVLARITMKLLASRGGPLPSRNRNDLKQLVEEEERILASRDIMAEAADSIAFPDTSRIPSLDSRKTILSAEIQSQLQDFVATIASMYQNHLFHNFEHASHVTLSLTKLISRFGNERYEKSIAKPNGWCIEKDPLSEFALVFAALIHGVDHPGVSNNALTNRDTQLVRKYGKKSCTELNAIEVGWAVLMRPAYEKLRRTVYKDVDELKRFRKLVVTLVLATDITNTEKSRQRQQLWDKCFKQKQKKGNKSDASSNQTSSVLLLENMMQAADIAHCTQHWNVYTKWNKRLFREMYEDFKRNQDKKDPVEFWYQGELSFFDKVVIPLALRLKQSGAFADQAEEYLNYARSNRRDWHSKGRDMLMDYMSDYRGISKHSSSTATTDSSNWNSDSSLRYKPSSRRMKPSSYRSTEKKT